jgi:prepilin-type N-terminal cleavage/methylation domain-containing protein
MNTQSLRRKTARSGESGMTLIELMIAMVVLATGMCAIAILITTAIASNGRNKGDTTATMVAQTFLSKISTFPANQNAGVGSPALTVTDCRPGPLGGAQVLNIPTAGAGAPGGNGATLVPVGQLSAGTINWNVPAVPGYSVIYYVCAYSNANAGTAQPFEVRWNVINLNTIGGVTYSKLVTVSARPRTPIGGASQMKFYQPPVTLRTIVNMN